MKLFQHKNEKIVREQQSPGVYILLSFFIPFLLILVALAGLHVTPFGDKTLIIADADGLYINYLSYVGRLVKGLEGFTYSFEKGLGGNMMPHMGITMLNPFFVLFADQNFSSTFVFALGKHPLTQVQSCYFIN